jgi:hypothetical protein
MSVKRCGFSRRIGNVSAANLTKTLVDSPEGEKIYQLQMSVKRCGFTRRKGGGREGIYQLLISRKPGWIHFELHISRKP